MSTNDTETINEQPLREQVQLVGTRMIVAQDAERVFRPTLSALEPDGKWATTPQAAEWLNLTDPFVDNGQNQRGIDSTTLDGR